MEEIAKETVSLAKAALGSNDHKAFFEAFGFKVYEEVCIGNVGEPNGIEIETYTDGGEDMVIGIEVDGWQDSFREYVDGFNATESVMTWWREGEDKAHERGVPFANIIEHYEDYMGWIAWLKDIVRVMDGKEPERVASDIEKAQLLAIRKWVYWTFNYFEPAKFVRDIWGDGFLADHILQKFHSYDNNMCRLYCELDRENQEKLATYVMENYKG